MPQSFGSIHLHYIFSTKHRQPWLTDDITERLNGFVGGLARARKCTLTKMGGVADHVHLLVQSARDIAPSVFMADIKALSSGWIHTEFPKLKDFGWQVGYGVFSVSYSAIESVKKYIENQAEHHKTKSFQEEFRDFLVKHEMAFDERCIWDWVPVAQLGLGVVGCVPRPFRTGLTPDGPSGLRPHTFTLPKQHNPSWDKWEKLPKLELM